MRLQEGSVLKMERNDKGQFVLGHNGGPGRPKGSRNQLGEALLADLCADWCEHGAEAVRRVREDRPSDYLKVIALIVAKGGMDSNFAVTVAHAQELEEFIEERRQKAEMQIAKMWEEPTATDTAGKPWEGSQL
jgi:hypothetical protein